MKWLIRLVLFSSVLVQAQEQDFFKSSYVTPTRQLAIAEFPKFTDDYDLVDMELAAQRQLDHFNGRNLSGTIELGHQKFPLTKAVTSLQLFLKLIGQFKACKTSQPVAACYKVFNDKIQLQFNVFAPELVVGDPRYGEPLTSFFTGYATQPINGHSQKDATFKHAVYGLPSSAQRTHTRDEIDFHDALNGQQLELLYADNLWDLYMLHIEGGGYVTLDDNGKKTGMFLSYDGTNHQHWSWISKYMMSQGYISNPSNGAQRKFLRLHPDKLEEIFSQCPSYVYFKFSDTPPMGAGSVVLTGGRSLATDIKLYEFKGLLTFIESQRAVENGNYDMEEEDRTKIPFQAFSRFFVDQDTGGAITGKGRADLYFGLTDYAQYAANFQAEKGNMYFLLAK